MSDDRITSRTWAIGVMVIGLSGLVGYSLPRHDNDRAPAARGHPADETGQSGSSGNQRQQVAQAPQAPAPEAPKQAAPAKEDAAARPAGASASQSAAAAFTPPRESAIPDNGFGEMVLLGEAIFHDTQHNASAFVGNDLNCSNCHIDRGRLANSAPLWAAYVKYPAYRSKNGHVNTFAERLQGCFKYSMNGKAPPLGDKVLVALESYAFFLAKGAPTGVNMQGRGYPGLPKPKTLDRDNGRAVYAQNCALCHGDDGQGQKAANGTTVFPPLWGARSYNWGAGMGSMTNAAHFIKANMPLGKGGSLSDKDAWDVAAYLDSHERPQDPRFTGSVDETRKKYHNSPMSLYGTVVNGVKLGEKSPPSGPQSAD